MEMCYRGVIYQVPLSDATPLRQRVGSEHVNLGRTSIEVMGGQTGIFRRTIEQQPAIPVGCWVQGHI